MAARPRKVEKLWLYIVVYALLMLLLIMTVAAAQFDLGRGNVVIALVIACLKAMLVILFFMHVRHSSRLTWIVAAAGFVWLMILLALTMTDYTWRDSNANQAVRESIMGNLQGSVKVSSAAEPNH